MTKQEREVESLLLKERRALIESDTDRKSFRIKGSHLFVDSRKYGSIINSKFVLLSNHSTSPSSSGPDHQPQSEFGTLDSSSQSCQQTQNTGGTPVSSLPTQST